MGIRIGLFTNMDFESNIKLNKLGSFRIGGEARFFKEARTIEELIQSVNKARMENLPLFVLGGGTNILWADSGFDGLVLKPTIETLRKNEFEITAGAGILMVDLLEFTILHGFSGLEWAGGLPGTLGGAVRGNAGAFGGEIKDIIKGVLSLDVETSELIRRNNDECEFDYRTSVFKTNGREIIIEIILSLLPGEVESIKNNIENKISYRRERHPMEYPNAGSVFKNVSIAKYPNLDLERFNRVIKQDPFPVIPTAFLISETGLRGISNGGAMISPKHPNFIVNVLDATSQDVKNLIKLVKSAVLDKFAIELEEEILIF